MNSTSTLSRSRRPKISIWSNTSRVRTQRSEWAGAQPGLEAPGRRTAGQVPASRSGLEVHCSIRRGQELAPGADSSHQRVDRVTPSALRAPSGNLANVPAGPGQCCGGFMRCMSREVPRRYMAGDPTGISPPVACPAKRCPFSRTPWGRTRLRPDQRFGAASRGQMSGRGLLRRRQTDLFHHRRRIPIIGLAADLSGLQLEDARAPHR